MRKTTSVVVSLLVATTLLTFAGCSKENVEFKSDENVTEQESDYNIEEAFYHEDFESWVVPQKDPYRLTNFQKAYDRILSGNSKQILTRSQIENFDLSNRLSATHYALKIYPKNEDEQCEVESMEGINIAYLPFDYILLPESQAENIQHTTRSASINLLEQSPYSVIYEDFETNEGPVDPITLTMPILYAVWPCDRPLPEHLEYKMDYEIFIPPYTEIATRNDASTLDFESLFVLEQEAISIALGKPITENPHTRSGNPIRTLRSKVDNYDNFLEKYIALANLKQRFQLGSNIWETYTMSDGTFTITAPIPDNASYSHEFHLYNRWKITTDNSTNPFTCNLGTVRSCLIDSPVVICPTSSVPAYEIHPALNFYWNGSHSLNVWSYSNAMRIIASTKTNSSNGVFSYSSIKDAYITIYKNNINNHSIFKGTILHELGHWTQYCERGGYSKYKKAHLTLRESFASFAGWYMGERYYTLHGWRKPYNSSDITGQARQGWTPSSTSSYSPLFVDLVDDYNQNSQNSSCNTDNIKNVPMSVMNELASAYNWVGVKNVLNKYVGVYYNRVQLNEFLAPYERVF